MNTQMSSIQRTTQSYVTPDVILKFFKEDKINRIGTNSSNKTKDKRKTMKSAFNELRNFSKALQGNPFYNDKVSYPIYIEHSSENNSSDYDFLLLSNDLVNKETLDEITYNDNLTVQLLYIIHMFYPDIRLSQLGKNGTSNEVRKNIALFVEFAKHNNIGIISAMLKIIKIAGMSKYSKNSGFNFKDIRDKILNAGQANTSDEFFKLFKNGKIVDVDFLINKTTHMHINDFFNPDQGVSLNRGTINNAAPQASDNLTRQFLSGKTHEYNKLLAIVDSLLLFNNSNEVFKNEDDSIVDATIKLSGNLETININHEEIIESVRGKYFELFIKDLLKALNLIQARAQDDYVEITTSRGKKRPDTSTMTEYEKVQSRIEYNEHERDAAWKKYQNELATNGDTVAADNFLKRHNDLQTGIHNLSNSLYFLAPEHKDPADKQLIAAENITHLKYNIGEVQEELTGVLHAIESIIYKEGGLDSIFEFFNNANSSRNSDPLKQDEFETTKIENEQAFFAKIKKDSTFSYDVEHLISAIFDSINVTLQHTYGEAMVNHGNYFNQNISNLAKDDDVITPEDVNNRLTNPIAEKNIKQFIRNPLEKHIFILFKRMYNEFGAVDRQQTKAYAKLRLEKNAVIKKTVMHPSNFKSYILSTEVLENLYEMIFYTNSQKYINGLIATPPSKIHSPINIQKFMLKQFGLENNPVYIVNSSRNEIILNSPDFLSLTGNSFYSNIQFSALKNICKIDYNKLLWNDQQMFKSENNEIIKKTNSDYKDLFTQLNTDLNAALSEYTTAKDKHADLIKQKASSAVIEAEKTAMKIAKSKHDSLLAAHKSKIEEFKKKNETSKNIESSQQYQTSSYQHNQFEDYTKDNKNNKNIYKEHKAIGKDGKKQKNGKQQNGKYNGQQRHKRRPY